MKTYLIKTTNDKYLAGFRLLKSGLDIGLTDLKDEAYVYKSFLSARATIAWFKLPGLIEVVNSRTVSIF